MRSNGVMRVPTFSKWVRTVMIRRQTREYATPTPCDHAKYHLQIYHRFVSINFIIKKTLKNIYQKKTAPTSQAEAGTAGTELRPAHQQPDLGVHRQSGSRGRRPSEHADQQRHPLVLRIYNVGHVARQDGGRQLI